jgi:hypothetical protein
MDTATNSVLSSYLKSYRGLIETEDAGSGTVVLSFPFHYSGNHRIEVSVAHVSRDLFVISDMARTLQELHDAGHAVSGETLTKLEAVAGAYGVTVRESHMLLESSSAELGSKIHRFVEAAKTVGDAYLAFRSGTARKEDKVAQEIRYVLKRRRLAYKERHKIAGKLEKHSVNFLVPPNGNRGLAIAILAGSAPHITAEAWGFKSMDIRNANPRLLVGLVYDVTNVKWSAESKKILEQSADLAIPSDAIFQLENQLVEQGIASPA